VVVVATVDHGSLVRSNGDDVRRIAAAADVVVELRNTVQGVMLSAGGANGRRTGRPVRLPAPGDGAVTNRASWLATRDPQQRRHDG
jgi:hypothetical protein